MLSSLAVSGAVLGFSISAPVGPMGLMCINRTLRNGVWAGVSTGAGATTVQLVYGLVLILTLDGIRPWLDCCRAPFSLLGAGLMLFFAWRLLRARRRDADGAGSTGRSLLMTYATAAAFNATNPMLMLLMIGGVATVLDPASGGSGDVRLLLGGLFLGSITWWICLSGLTALLSSRISPRGMGLVDRAIAMVLLGFSVAAAARAGGLLA